MLKRVFLEVVNNPCPYNQSPQSSDIEFCMLQRKATEGTFKELHYKVKCREYLGDANIAAHLNRKTPKIYGFELNGRMALNESIFSLHLEKNSHDNLRSNIRLLNRLERKLNISETELYLTDYGYILVSIGSPFWMKSPLLVSIYSFILRALTYRKSSKRKLSSYLKDISPSVSDYIYAKRLTRLDLEFLLLNIDEVLGENPISGIDDSILIPSKAFSNSENVFLKYINYNNKINHTQFGVWTTHSNHGFNNLNTNLKNVENLKTLDIGYPHGAFWAINYSNILLRNNKSLSDE